MVGEWDFPPVAEVLETAGIWQINDYMQRSQDAAVAQVDFWTIYDLFTGE